MGGTRLYVGGVSHGTNERDVERFFRSYGRLRDIVLKNGFCFVEFEDHRDADDAVYELNGKDLNGDRVTIEFARAGPGGGRGFGRGGFRGGYGGGGGGGYGRPPRRPRAPWMDKYGVPQRTDNRIIIENLSSRVSWQTWADIVK